MYLPSCKKTKNPFLETMKTVVFFSNHDMGDENVVKQTFFVVYEKLLTILLSFLFNYE